MSTSYDTDYATEALVDFIDSEAESLAHACRMAAERNREGAALAEGIPHLIGLLTESAESWERKADRLMALVERLPDR